MTSAMLSPHPIRVESVMQHVSNTSIDRCEIKQIAVELHLPLIELFLLLAVLKFSIKDDEEKAEEKNLENTASPDA